MPEIELNAKLALNRLSYICPAVVLWGGGECQTSLNGHFWSSETPLLPVFRGPRVMCSEGFLNASL